MVMTSDYKIRQKLITIFLIISFLVSSFVTIMVYKHKYPNDYKVMKTKTETVDENSIEFFIGNNLLDKTYNKIKKEKFDEIDFIDKQKVNNIIKWYNENEYNYISIDGTKIKLNDFLKNNDTEIKKYLPSIDSEVRYFAIFYKIVIDKNTSYVNCLDKNINGKLIKQAVENKQIMDTKNNIFNCIFSIAATSTIIMTITGLIVFDTIVYIDKKWTIEK